MMTHGTNDDTLKDLLRPSMSVRKGTDRQRLVTTDVNTARAATSGSTIVSNGVRGRIGVDAETVWPSSGSGRLERPMESPRRTAASVFGNTIRRLVTLGLAKLRMVLSTCVAAPTVIDFSANECSEIGMKEPRTPVKDTNPPLSTKTPSSSVKDPMDQSASSILLSLPNGTCHSFTRSISVASVLTQFSASFPRQSIVIVSERSPGQIYPKLSQKNPPLPLTHILTPADGYSLRPMGTCAPASQVSDAHGSSEGQMAEVRGR